MGSSLLIVIAVLPFALALFDLIRIALDKKRQRHGVLLCVGILLALYCIGSAVNDGLPWVQGAVVASLCYGPVYLLTFAFIVAAEKTLATTAAHKPLK